MAKVAVGVPYQSLLLGHHQWDWKVLELGHFAPDHRRVCVDIHELSQIY